MRSIFLILFLLMSSSLQAASIKEPNVAGSFYSSDAKELSTQIDAFLNQTPFIPVDKKVQAMIVPHAGYIYSGPVAAWGYKAVSKNKYSTIVILGPSHYFPFDGISVWSEGGFKTPLGVAKVDEDFAKKLIAADPQFKFSPKFFEKEHSVEVQIPFIQKIFGDVKIVPIIMGNPNPTVVQKLASVLNDLVGSRDDVLVIASSDMSHYYPYDEANKMDEETLITIAQDDPQKLWDANLERKMEMCGFVPVSTVLLYAKERGLKVQILKHANSGDTQGDKSKVVGYSSTIFYPRETSQALDGGEKKALLKLAHDTLVGFVTNGLSPETKTKDERLQQMQGAFVTLRKKGQLRGCIGNIIGDKPLWQTIRDMTIAAASTDPRFPRVKKEELKDIDLEISVLSIPQRIPDASKISLGKDGVIVSDGGLHQGVFLPQVAGETHWGRDEFLNELCSQKAGMASDCWKDPRNSLWTFQADVFSQ